MTIYIEDEIEVVPNQKYPVGSRVIWTAKLNNPGHWEPDTKIEGVVVNAFCNYHNPPTFTYTLKLDIVWKADRVPTAAGKQIIAGNIFEESISPLVPSSKVLEMPRL